MKKALVLILTVLIIAAMSGCVSHEERLESVMKLVHGMVTAEQSPPPPSVPILPETDPPKDPRDETESAAWPKEIPAPKDYQKIYAAVRWEGEFRAHFLMTSAQVAAWETVLTTAGFAGTPFSDGEWTIEITTEELAGDQDVFKVLAVVREAADKPAWDPLFSAFPVYTTEFPYKSYSVTMDGSAMVMEIVIENEQRGRVNAYVQSLVAAGFADRGYGFYAKDVGGKTYEFQTDGIWAVETEARLIWRVY